LIGHQAGQCPSGMEDPAGHGTARHALEFRHFIVGQSEHILEHHRIPQRRRESVKGCLQLPHPLSGFDQPSGIVAGNRFGQFSFPAVGQ
jgi:hypothetical protein